MPLYLQTGSFFSFFSTLELNSRSALLAPVSVDAHPSGPAATVPSANTTIQPYRTMRSFIDVLWVAITTLCGGLPRGVSLLTCVNHAGKRTRFPPAGARVEPRN